MFSTKQEEKLSHFYQLVEIQESFSTSGIFTGLLCSVVICLKQGQRLSVFHLTVNEWPNFNASFIHSLSIGFVIENDYILFILKPTSFQHFIIPSSVETIRKIYES